MTTEWKASNSGTNVNASLGVESSGGVSTPVGTVTSRLAGASSREFTTAHINSDVDADPGSQHHTLGLGPNQALPGNLYQSIMDDIAALQAKDLVHDGQITALQNADTAIQADINALEAKDLVHDGQISTLNGQVSTINGQITTINGQITTINNNITTINTTLTALNRVGDCILWFDDVIPNSFMLLRGADISRTTYSALFALWGTKYGTGDGTTTFGTPDTRFRELIGTDVVGSIGTSDAVAFGSRLAARNHSHSHNTGTNVTGNTAPGNTGSSVDPHGHTASADLQGGHNHGSTSSDGSHDHSGTTGSTNPPGATTTGGGAVSRLQDTSHQHSISSGGNHSHTVSSVSNHLHNITVSSPFSSGHDHTNPSHAHTTPALTTDFGTMFGTSHPSMYVGIIVRYTTNTAAAGVS